MIQVTDAVEKIDRIRGDCHLIYTIYAYKISSVVSMLSESDSGSKISQFYIFYI